MEISDRWAPLLLQSVRDAIRYRQQLLESETARDLEDGEEALMHLGELLAYLRDEYEKNEGKFKYTAAEVLGEAPSDR